LQARYVLLVAAGGSFGTAARLGVSELLPGGGDLPTAVIVINLSGALALGWLLAALHRSRIESPLRKSTQLAVGTGFFGGYTTYSAFAVDTDGLLTNADPLLGLALSAGTAASGVVLGWLGSWLVPRPATGRADR
jgi:CrcB protein